MIITSLLETRDDCEDVVQEVKPLKLAAGEGQPEDSSWTVPSLSASTSCSGRALRSTLLSALATLVSGAILVATAEVRMSVHVWSE